MSKTKSNKLLTISVLLCCIFFILKPNACSVSVLNSLSLWGLKVFPVMFPFFIFTRILLSFMTIRETKMDKLFNRLFHTPNGSAYVFFLSILSGYPMGAKLIGQMYEQKQISNMEAQKMLSMCSISGPMFIVGTVGVGFLMSKTAGIIILLSNILSSITNGFVFRGKNSKKEKLDVMLANKNINLADIMYDSLVSILMVGGFIILSCLFIDLIENFNLFCALSKTICKIPFLSGYENVLISIFNGILEITRGCFDLAKLNVPMSLKIVISSGLIGLGGLSIMLQSFAFLNKVGISKKTIFLQKISQAIFSIIYATILVLIIL